MKRKTVRSMAAAGMLLASGATGPAWGIINPRFTPADLVRGSSSIYALELRIPEDETLDGKVTEVLKGERPANESISFGLTLSDELAREAVAAAFGPSEQATGILLLSAGGGGGDIPVGFLQINTLWYAVNGASGQWWLAPDRQDMFAVWAGTARMLAEATRYALADPAAVFPVQSRMAWAREAALGKGGKARGCMAVDFAGTLGACVLLYGDGGDRLFKPGGPGADPADATKAAALTTASVRVAPGDFDGDGRMDLMSWDGKKLRLAVQAQDGVFVEKPVGVTVEGCVSLAAVAVGAGPAGGCVAGTLRGPILLSPDNESGFDAAPLGNGLSADALAALGGGGACVAADFNDDGLADVLAVFERGTVLYPGRQGGGYGAGVVTTLPLVKSPAWIICGDYDTDGRLDAIVCGEDGLVLLSRSESERLDNYTHATGEFTYHGNANRRRVVGVSAADINADGRQGAAAFYAEGVPLVFFNRGFACFGMARELHLAGGADMGGGMPGAEARPALKAAEALQRGQAAGLMWDLDGDSVQDMLAVAPDGEAWALFGGAGGNRSLGITIAAPNARGPLTVTVSDAKRRLGMHVVRPGVPVFVGRENPGAVTLSWKAGEGKLLERRVVVMKSVRVEL